MPGIHIDPNTLVAIFTLGLAIATVWLAFATHRLANITRKAFDLEARPYFAFGDFVLRIFLKRDLQSEATRQSLLRVGLVFKNPGKIPVHYKLTEISVTFSGQTVDKPRFQNMGGIIYPGDSSIFWYGNIENVDVSSLPKQGIVEYKAEYRSDVTTQLYETFRKIEYTLNSIEPYSLDWIYLDQSDK